MEIKEHSGPTYLYCTLSNPISTVSKIEDTLLVFFSANSSLVMTTDFAKCNPNNVDSSNDLPPEIDNEILEADLEEKQRLISQILELQHTLEDLSTRVDAVKEENLKLRSENQILGQYIENMMANSSVFQSTSPRVDENRSRTNKRVGR
ncbi:unnamed protein product [Schistosoma margrebowiei]|uniref:Short coiled-coil protein n=3 Tax=Schistosoma TaxID=6181 RepID=A0AA85AAM2_9TREM|nr:unnamed protein product [Schistosoma margrebowiei]